MKTIHLYLTRQILVTLLMTVAVCTFVLMLGTVLKEVLGLLMNRNASLWVVAQAVGLLIPFVLVFALPMGMLTATLMVFGRFSADNELTAARASGISLVSMITPVLILSVLLSGVAAWMNMEVAPQSRVAYLRLLYKIGMSKGAGFLPEKTYISDFKDAIVYIGKVRGTNLSEITAYTLKDGQVDGYVRAERGRVQSDRSNSVVTVWLEDAYQVSLEPDKGGMTPRFAEEMEFTYTNQAPRWTEKRDVRDMTQSQLWQLLGELEKRLQSSPALGKQSNEELLKQKRALLAQRKADITAPVRIQIHRQISFSFACIGFTLVGIPLGIRAHRRETTFGIAMGLILVVLYYSFFILGQSLEAHPEWSPHLILWLPNFIFQATGMVLLWRANRGGH